MYFKKNEKCEECKIPFKFLWNCKRTLDEKVWILLCYNCIRHFKNVNRWRFKSQLQNIKGFRWCKLDVSKIELPFYQER